jgi:hypothetical protein
VKLHDIAYGRSGDKGDIANVPVIVYDEADWDLVRREVTVERVREHFGSLVEGDIVRYEIPGIKALNFVMTTALSGGVSMSLRIDPHGKSYGSHILAMEIEPDRRA